MMKATPFSGMEWGRDAGEEDLTEGDQIYL